MNPVHFALRHPQVTGVLAGMAFVVGLQALLTMPRRETPEITIREGQVIAEYPGATPEQVEEQVTKKIEARLFRFSEVRKDRTESTSRFGVSVVKVELEESVTDKDRFWSKLRHEMNELRQTELPQGVRGPIVNSEFGDVVAILLAVQGERYGYRELKDYLDEIDDALRTLPAVSKIKRFGEQREEFEVTATSDRLTQYGLVPEGVMGPVPSPPDMLVAALQAQNVIVDAGDFDTGASEVLLRTTGLLQSEEQLRSLIVGVTPQGQTVRVGDVATVRRKYEDPEYLVRLNGKPAILLSIEMQSGNNIVQFGEAIDAKLEEIRPLLPPDLQITLVADQPKLVEESVSHFIREFGIAVLAVILVTMALLPLRVALVTVVAIPMTISMTFAVMSTLGIELHTASIAGLIVALGMVVDNAIVIADNYVELLDHKVPPSEAAGRSATELVVPILTATLTIVAAFLPLSFLSGEAGEFIRTLPITVTVALLCSFIVAMLLTPLLCRTFIKKGLHSDAAPRHRFSPLDLMQQVYDRGIKLAMANKRIAVVAGALSIVLGVVLLMRIPQQFFPYAERDQLLVNIWMPEGTRIEETDRIARQLEAHVLQHEGVEQVTTFLGAGSPRFFYNVTPEFLASNYAQLLVGTTSAEVTPEIVRELHLTLGALAPDARINAKELQEGPYMHAPIEVRVIGDDIRTLKRIGARVADILRDTPESFLVHRDWHEDSYNLLVAVDTEVANRHGLQTALVAQQLSAGFSGRPVSTYWEGSHAVDITIRYPERERRTFEDIKTSYVLSQLTRARLPLLEVARVNPEWQTSRILRRNGVRTLTVRSEAMPGVLPSEILAKAAPQIDRLELPAGYSIQYGGEREEQDDTFAEMRVALAVGLLVMFLILLFQFRSVFEPPIVMVSIPLALFGAALGLMITGNPFGFTAFMGLISLAGVALRGSIILIDHIIERRTAGTELEAAAIEASQRRLRPIFLTTMAAAVGVLPMIFSGSPLWSPMASVISVGLVCSMVFTLIVVPVLYVLVERRRGARAS